MPFPETRLSVLEAARSADESERARGLDALATAYAEPLRAYLRVRWGRDDESARDLTQELFLKLVEKRWLDGYDPGKAKLRTWLRVLVDGLASDEAKAAGRLKRGGGAAPVPLDDEAGRARAERDGAASFETPDAIFEREWRRSVLGRAVERLRAACEASGLDVRFAIFAARDLAEEDPAPAYDDLAARFGVKTTDVTNHLFAARRDVKRFALEILSAGAASDDEARREARELLGP